MNKFFALLVIISLFSCVSVEKYNQKLAKPIPEQKLRADIAFTYKTLQKLQPNLYWYISKEKLDFKFDSLQKSIKAPMTSFNFYKNLSKVTGAIGQGHFYIFPNTQRYSKERIKAVNKKGSGLFSQFNHLVFDDKLFVINNIYKNKSFKSGDEIVAINNVKVKDLLDEYKTLFTSDGYNKTFFPHNLTRKFSTYYANQYGILDSLVVDFKNKDSLKTVVLKRIPLDTATIKKPVIALTKAQKKAQKEKNRLLGFDSETKTYMRNLSFKKQDSSIAVIKINGFRSGDYKKCYKNFFDRIKQNKAKVLVLDLRNNGGGRLNEIANLYTYLADTTFVFMQPSEVASKTSMMSTDYFKGSSWVAKPFLLALSPLFYTYTFFRTYKKADGKYYVNEQTKPRKIAANNFKGKLYVLINGGSFSASSIISSNLKGSKRAIFVGEETGGTFNGTVAGQMPLVKLPNSNLRLRVGLMTCTPFHQTDVVGRGIFPDVEIVTTLQDKINNIDNEMNWILKDLENSEK